MADPRHVATFGPGHTAQRAADGSLHVFRTDDATGAEESGVGAESWVGSRKRSTGYEIKTADSRERARLVAINRANDAYWRPQYLKRRA